jgi:hypothetical protein
LESVILLPVFLPFWFYLLRCVFGHGGKVEMFSLLVKITQFWESIPKI